jgi:6-phosphogluconolactonase (cycloisomerase 2 family)
LGPQRQPKSP